MTGALLVVLGAAVGAPLRYLADRAMRTASFPWGTFAVNVTGSGVLGALAAAPAGTGLMALAGTGFCGALTTYSTFGYETWQMIEDGAGTRALLYAGGSITAGLTTAYTAMTLMSAA